MGVFLLLVYVLLLIVYSCFLPRVDLVKAAPPYQDVELLPGAASVLRAETGRVVFTELGPEELMFVFFC